MCLALGKNVQFGMRILSWAVQTDQNSKVHALSFVLITGGKLINNSLDCENSVEIRSMQNGVNSPDCESG